MKKFSNYKKHLVLRKKTRISNNWKKAWKFRKNNKYFRLFFKSEFLPKRPEDFFKLRLKQFNLKKVLVERMVLLYFKANISFFKKYSFMSFLSKLKNLNYLVNSTKHSLFFNVIEQRLKIIFLRLKLLRAFKKNSIDFLIKKGSVCVDNNLVKNPMYLVHSGSVIRVLNTGRQFLYPESSYSSFLIKRFNKKLKHCYSKSKGFSGKGRWGQYGGWKQWRLANVNKYDSSLKKSGLKVLRRYVWKDRKKHWVLSAKGFKFSNQNLSKKIKVRNNNVRQVTPPLNTRKRVKFISRYSSPLPNTFLSALFPKATTGLEYKFPFSIKKGLKKTASKKKYKISFISSLKLFTEKRKGKSFYNFNPWISTYIFKKPVPFGNIFYGRVLSKQMLNLIVDKHW